MSSQAEQIVSKMMEHDAFSRWLGIRVLSVEEGAVCIEMDIREDMVNGFGISHGGIAFSLADSALAFASTSYGRVSLALETNMSFTSAVRVGDTLQATATQESLGARIAVFNVRVENQSAELVASFRGTVFRRSQDYLESIERKEA